MKIILSIILASFACIFSLGSSAAVPERAAGLLETQGQIIHVPGDAPTIQAGIDLAAEGDTVLVAPGEYYENLQISGKTITLASQFYTTGNPGLIDQTVIDGSGATVITVARSVGPATKITGFTIRNGEDGIKAKANLNILNNHFAGHKDAIDYADGGGLCRANIFENNTDDAVDVDGATEVTIEDNTIQNNGDDGIEIRLHAYSGPTLNIVIRNNRISGNKEDGIQLIDYPGLSDRIIWIERNLIENNAQVGLGLMDNGDSNEDFRAASIPERIHVVNNTFVSNPYAITGGDNLIALNNLFVGSAQIALKGVDADSIAAHNLFWNNGADFENSVVDVDTTLTADPLLDADYGARAGSPAIDAGGAYFEWNGETVLDLSPDSYAGAAPDLGWHEKTRTFPLYPPKMMNLAAERVQTRTLTHLWMPPPGAGSDPTEGYYSDDLGNRHMAALNSNTRASQPNPIINVQPPSTLLSPGTTTLNLSVQSTAATACAFSLGAAQQLGKMTRFDRGAGTTRHETLLRGLDPDPRAVNRVYVRCASDPDYLLELKYRSLPQANPPYPRTGNLWGWRDLFAKGLPYMARIDLWLGAGHAPVEDILELRRLNPNILMLASINAVDEADLPDDYYLKDIYGNRLEVRPDVFRLNLTKMYVAEYQANHAYQQMLESDLMFDGVFFDNVFTTQAWRNYDVHGNPFLVDSDENGIEDDPAAFDAAWKAGVFHELETFRALMPNALMSGHAMNINEPGIAEIFNGISLGFRTADVLEGEMHFWDLWDEYQAWHELARQPHLTMIESSPPDQIAYGYGYAPWENIPASTLEFARTYFPYVRFGLTLTLMQAGYFAHEFGDTWHGNDWWYDELDYNLGAPLGPAERVDLGIHRGENRLVNGGFEAASTNPWLLRVNEVEGNAATLQRDTADKAIGAASARVNVAAASGVPYHVGLAQENVSLEQGVVYDVIFWAKSDRQRTITLSSRRGVPESDGTGLWRDVSLGTDWTRYEAPFVASETTNNARIQFLLGETTGTVWVDEVSLTVRPPDVYQRKFTNGLVLLNGSEDRQEISVGPGYWRLRGEEAARYEVILDDGGPSFSTSGTWLPVVYDSGELRASGPFYHCWKESCHQRSGSQGEARWNLEIPAEDTYTITAWWPAGPNPAAWNSDVTFEVVSGQQVIAAQTFDQRSGGDEWHIIGEVNLSPGNANYVRMYCQGEAPCLADALHLRSRARYNDGAPVRTVVLQPLDGIILANHESPQFYLPLVTVD